MSLIFNALRKNRPGSPAVEKSSEKAAPLRKGLSFRIILSSPIIILLLASTIFLSGVIVSYIVQSFTAHTAQGATDASKVEAREPQYKVFAPDPDASAQSRPKVQLSQEFPADPPLEDINTIETAKEPGGGTIEFTVEMPDSIDAVRGQSDIPDTLPADPASIHDQDQKKIIASGDSSVKLSMIHARESDTTKPASGTRTGAGKNYDTVHVQDSPPDPPEKSVLEIERERRAREHWQTSRLAGQIMGAIQSGDHDSVVRLFSELEHLKGKNHYFILKLKAYWMIQKGRLDQARTLLSNVLILRPDDIEAGLNMAVVDIMEGKHVQARTRLEKLQQLYPEETAIAVYLSQLRP